MGKSRELADFADKLGTEFTIDSSGNVVIGGSSGVSPLHVYGDNNAITMQAGTASQPSYMLWRDNTGTNRGIMGHLSNTDMYLWNYINGPLLFGVNNTEGMRLTTTGLGIGTSSPSNPLAVVGSAGTLASFTNGVDADLLIQASSGVTTLTPSTGTLAFGTSSTERMRIDSSGNVGFGTSSINKNLVVHGGASDSTIQLTTTNSGTGATDGLQFAMGTSGDAVIHQRESGVLQFIMAGSEATRILADGTQVWGATLEGTNGSMAINNAGYIHGARDGIVSYFDRKTTSGYISEWRSNGTTIGALGNIGTAGCFVGNSDTGLAYRPDSVALYPYNPAGLAGRDNAIDLGVSGARFDDIYATNNVIQTSDERLKTNIRDITEAETRVAKALKGMMKAYQWTESVEEKGDDARIHFGVIAQEVQATFEAEGLDAGRYAMFIHDHWFIDPEDGQIYKEQNEEGTREAHDRMGIRYPELFAFIIAAL